MALPMKNCVEAASLDAKPVSSSLSFTSQAARIMYGATAGKSADAAFLRSTLNPSPPSFLACFFLFSFLFVSSKPVTFLFLRFLPIFSLLCTTCNFAKFQTFFSVFLSPHSDCPLIRCDEALWRNVIFSRKKKLENQNLGNSAFSVPTTTSILPISSLLMVLYTEISEQTFLYIFSSRFGQ